MKTTVYARIVVLFVAMLAIAIEIPLFLNESEHPIVFGRYSARAWLGMMGIALAATLIFAAAALKWPQFALGISLSGVSVLITIAGMEGFARLVLQVRPDTVPVPIRFTIVSHMDLGLHGCRGVVWSGHKLHYGG